MQTFQFKMYVAIDNIYRRYIRQNICLMFNAIFNFLVLAKKNDKKVLTEYRKILLTQRLFLQFFFNLLNNMNIILFMFVKKKLYSSSTLREGVNKKKINFLGDMSPKLSPPPPQPSIPLGDKCLFFPLDRGHVP